MKRGVKLSAKQKAPSRGLFVKWWSTVKDIGTMIYNTKGYIYIPNLVSANPVALRSYAVLK